MWKDKRRAGDGPHFSQGKGKTRFGNSAGNRIFRGDECMIKEGELGGTSPSSYFRGLGGHLLEISVSKGGPPKRKEC